MLRWLIHYRTVGVWPGWNLLRVKQCARLLGVTLSELAASCAIRRGTMSIWIEKGWFPPHAALLFKFREEEWLSNRGLKD